jgi:hypothetical protein
MNECLRDVKNGMREEFKSHESFDQNKYSDRKELDDLSTSAVRQNTRNPQGDAGHAMNTNQFGGHGDGVGKRGGQDFNQCMDDNAGGKPKYDTDGSFVSSYLGFPPALSSMHWLKSWPPLLPTPSPCPPNWLVFIAWPASPCGFLVF